MDNFTKSVFSRSLKIARDELGLTQGEFASRIGLSTSSVYAWEKGITFPSPKTLELVSYIHGINKEFLVSGEGDVLLKP